MHETPQDLAEELAGEQLFGSFADAVPQADDDLAIDEFIGELRADTDQGNDFSSAELYPVEEEFTGLVFPHPMYPPNTQLICPVRQSLVASPELGAHLFCQS